MVPKVSVSLWVEGSVRSTVWYACLDGGLGCPIGCTGDLQNTRVVPWN